MDLSDVRRKPTYAVAALVVCCVVWWSFLKGVRVPVLGFVDLAVHEAGHVFFMWAPRDVMLAMGNGFQALVPLVFTGAFVLRHRDLAGGAATLAWAASSLQDASVYIADAPYRRLPLLGPESSHDWWQLLGGHGWLDHAATLSRVVWVLGLLVLLAAVGVLVTGLRWDEEWQDGEPGTLYLPWERRLASSTAASLIPGFAPSAGRRGADGAVPPGWEDVPWGTGRPDAPDADANGSGGG